MIDKKAEILSGLVRSRTAIARDAAAVRERLDVPAQIKKSFKSRPFAWLGGVSLAGFLFAWRKSRSKAPAKPAPEKSRGPEPAPQKLRGFWGIVLPLVKLAVPLFRPAVTAYAARKFGDLAERFGK